MQTNTTTTNRTDYMREYRRKRRLKDHSDAESTKASTTDIQYNSSRTDYMREYQRKRKLKNQNIQLNTWRARHHSDISPENCNLELQQNNSFQAPCQQLSSCAQPQVLFQDIQNKSFDKSTDVQVQADDYDETDADYNDIDPADISDEDDAENDDEDHADNATSDIGINGINVTIPINAKYYEHANGCLQFWGEKELLDQAPMDSQLDKHDPDLKNLLTSWALEDHWEHFVKEKITIKHLKLLQPKHIEKLFNNRPIGDQVLFEHHLEIWKMTTLLKSGFSSNDSSSTSQQNDRTKTNWEQKDPILNDSTRDMDLLVATESNDTEDSCIEEITDAAPKSFHITTPVPRIVVTTPRTVPPAAVTPIARHSHTPSVPTVTAAPVAAVSGPIKIAPFSSNIPCRYDLMKILTETSGGQMVLNYYNKHQHLREEHRTALINVIARYIDANGCTLTLSESNQLESQIVQMFPTEKAEFYRTTKRGRLYNKIANMKRTYKKFSKDVEGTPNVMTSGPSSPSSSTAGVIKEEEFVDEYNEYIVHDLRAKSQATGNFLEFWQNTQAMRLKNIDEIEYLQDILEKWPEYKETNMIEYISMDFYAKHPTATKFSQVFHDSIGKLEKLLFTKVSTCSAAFKNLQLYQKSSKESQHLIILWVIHQIFPPNHHMVMDENGVQRKKRYSIQDSQNACICIRSSVPLIDNFLHHKGSATPPMLLVVGELGLDIQELFVYFEGIRYPVNSVVQAAELCLELFFLFNIDFPEESLLYYNFMQTYFLNIEPDVKNSKIYTTINDLNAY